MFVNQYVVHILRINTITTQICIYGKITLEQSCILAGKILSNLEYFTPSNLPLKFLQKGMAYVNLLLF